ncbi:hypothetical protein EVA_07222, partial [gut metagenome]
MILWRKDTDYHKTDKGMKRGGRKGNTSKAKEGTITPYTKKASCPDHFRT